MFIIGASYVLSVSSTHLGFQYVVLFAACRIHYDGITLNCLLAVLHNDVFSLCRSL